MISLVAVAVERDDEPQPRHPCPPRRRSDSVALPINVRPRRRIPETAVGSTGRESKRYALLCRSAQLMSTLWRIRRSRGHCSSRRIAAHRYSGLVTLGTPLPFGLTGPRRIYGEVDRGTHEIVILILQSAPEVDILLVDPSESDPRAQGRARRSFCGGGWALPTPVPWVG